MRHTKIINLALADQEIKFYQEVANVLIQARQQAKRHVDNIMVLSYYEVGRMIVEQEQRGSKRAQYGKKIIIELSNHLSHIFKRSYSVENLKLMRRFYIVYSKDQIGESLITQFNPNLSWTHYIQLMRIENAEIRRFYEIETVNNGWTIRQLQRQYGSSLYERLALSRNKEKIKQLANEGVVVDKFANIFKDPYVLEFAGLD